ncbi:hypothetical protein [Parapedobacter sp. DT-150]|uniref:hypothetical protein n=1 Tax=Parapedobacter sp. DT-150 TaxID=3396162 RepID=UPI003F1C70E5
MAIVLCFFFKQLTGQLVFADAYYELFDAGYPITVAGPKDEIYPKEDLNVFANFIVS